MARQTQADPAPFDLESSLGFLVYKAHQRSFGELRSGLEPLRLTPPQFGVLALLYRADRQTQAALCELGAIDPNTMVGIVDRLEAAGLVARGPAPRDRRAHLVRITPRGRRMFERCLPLQRAAAEGCWAGLSLVQQNRLGNLLRQALRSWRPDYGREVRAHE
jgi:DNA-binding MarR family transcriptional regulator